MEFPGHVRSGRRAGIAQPRLTTPIYGTGPFSEAESRNAQWLVDHFPNARYFVDVHSYTGRVMHPWGDDENQTTDPSMSFKNPAWNGQRGRSGDTYRDYVPPARLAQLQTAVAVMHDGI